MLLFRKNNFIKKSSFCSEILTRVIAKEFKFFAYYELFLEHSIEKISSIFTAPQTNKIMFLRSRTFVNVAVVSGREPLFVF
jgi:hypothetical protein